MDYDDYDFQSQNFQLVGEDSSKFPPSLRSFALPKFDFDEHLQVNLRFDSLVEPEVLLGIQGQENNWIKDFSPGSSAIEFGSSAAESCCISRHNNVWSEATSSESVEMLLKSVGEDEMVNNKAVIGEADMHDQLNGIDDQMDPLIRQDDSQNSCMGDIVHSGPTPLADKSDDILSGSDKDAFRGQPQVEGMSQSSKDEKSEKDMDISSSDEKFNLDGKVVHKQHNADKTSDEVINEFFGTVQNDDSLDNAFMRKSTPDDHGCAPSGGTKAGSECRNTEDDPAAVSIDKSGMGAGKRKNRSFSEQIMEENKEVGMLEKSEGLRLDNLQKAYNQITCRDGRVDDHHSEGHALNNDFCRIKDSTCLDPSMGSLVYLNEGCNVPAFSENSDGLLEAIAYQGKALNRDSKTGDKVVANMNEESSLEVEGDREIEKHSIEVSNENMEKVPHMTETSKNVSHNETKLLSKDDDDFHVSTVPIKNTNIAHFGEELASFKEVIEEKQNLEGQLSDKNNNDSHNSKPIVVEKSVEDEDLRDTTEKSSVTLSASEDASLKESPLPALQRDAEVKVVSSTHDKSIEMKKTGIPEAESDVDDVIPQDISAIGKEYTAPFIDSCGANSRTDTSNVTEKMEEASFTDQNPGMATDGSSVRKLIQDESVADPATVGVESTSLNNSTVLHQSCSEDALGVDVVVGQKAAAVSPLPASECFQSDENDVKISASVTRSNLDSKISSETTTVADAVLDGSSPMKMVLDDSAETTKNKEKQPMPVHPSAQECSPGICQNGQQNSEANLTPGDNGDKQNLVGETNCDNGHTNRSPQSTMPRSNAESHLLEPGSGIQSSFEPSCGSPTVISCTEHSQDGVGYQEGSRGVLERSSAASDDLPHLSSETITSAGEVKSSDRDSKDGTASEDDRSFTFEVGSLAELSEKATANNWKPFSSMHSFELPQVSKENAQGGLKESEERSPQRTTTNTTGEVKSKQVSGRGTGKVSTSKRTAKETPSPKQAKGRERNTCSTSPTNDATISNNMRLEEMRQVPNVESCKMKASCSLAVQTSVLPDLNTSVSSAALIHQPFTDLQQVQLRAQIFVYGSLIQGIPPDEACMLSAFGGTDGGRSVWEGAWRAATERFQNQKSPLNIFETPIHSRSGVRVTEQATKSGPLQSKAFSTPASQSGIKVVPSTIVNSTMSLPSPLWSISSHDALASNVQRGTRLEFNQAVSPLHSYQSSQLRQYTGNTTPLFSLTPRPGSWVVSSQSPTLDASSQYSATPVAETIQVTPLRDSSTPRASNMQLVYPNTLLPTQAPMSVSATSVVQVESQNKSAISANTRNESTAQKSRKRKKGSAPEELGPMFLVSQPQTEPAFTTAVSKHLPTSGGFHLSTAPGGLVSASSHITSPAHFQIVGSGNAEQRVIISEETCSRIEQSELQAEAAAAHAAAAIRHSQGIWSQLAIQKKSGLVTEIEEKLVSAAVAAAAAASVAKVAAEAAKVASEAALQAKMVADEALSSAKTGHPGQNSETGLDVGKDLGRLTPVSILKGKDKINGSSSIISAAREAARRRVEAASAATKRAENLDAILKAAELAAEAVSQAGMIIAMGDPLPFTISDLVEAGPEGYWKVQHATIEKRTKTNGLHQEENLGMHVPGDHDIRVKQSTKRSLGHREMQKITDEEGITSHSDQATQSEENNIGITSVTVPTDRLERDSLASNLKGNSIQKGTLVEVVGDEDGLRGVWFSARVLDVKDGKAFVCYNDLVPHEGSGQLTEWIPLDSGKDKAPRIRVAHPITAVKPEGTRKRRREAVGNYAWAVGDRVDAWIRDGWWEGIVAEKIPGDETKLTVRFPGASLEARGDSSSVRTWNVRPSLIWKDGQWILWSRVRERNTVEPYEGDTPCEKRQKLGKLEGKIDSGIDGRGVGSTSTDMSSADSRKPEDSTSLNLSAKDKIFSIGKNVREESNSDAPKVKRTGQQKEGSRVVFGVPKPGKKRKFMEVSKHYTADKIEKTSEGNDSIKFAKYLMPQASRLWRSTSRVDTKGKRASDSKHRGLKSVKSQNIQARGTVERDSSSLTTTPASNGGESGLGSLPNVKASFTNEENNIGKKNLLEAGPLSTGLGTADTTAVESSVMPMPGVPSSNMKSSTAVEAEGVKEKVTHATDKSTGIEVKGSENPAKTVSDAIEPRRSNRRIQPTSRLLEGLQSSMIISKIPSVSHDRGARAQHRGASSSRGNAHG